MDWAVHLPEPAVIWATKEAVSFVVAAFEPKAVDRVAECRERRSQLNFVQLVSARHSVALRVESRDLRAAEIKDELFLEYLNFGTRL